MSEIKVDDMPKDIDEAEAITYRQIFGVFDKDNGNFIEAEIEENIINELPAIGRTTTRNEEAGELKASLHGKPVEEWDDQEQLQDVKLPENTENEINIFIKELSEKEISSMAITLNMNGITVEYVSDEKAGERYMPPESQIAKIKEVINGFKNPIVVHSQEELRKLQEEYKQKQENIKPIKERISHKRDNEDKKFEVRTQVYIRISEEDYEAVKITIEKEDIKIVSNKVTARGDKDGINMIIKAEDADKVRNILQQNKISILQDVDGNIDWVDIKERSKKNENVTVGQLREFQNANKDKFDYVAFRKEGKYTVFVDKVCNIAIGQKDLSQVNETVMNNRNPDISNKETKEKKQLNGNEYVSLENFIKEHENDKIEVLSPNGYINIMPGQTEFHAHNGHSGIPISFDEIKNEVINVKDMNYDNENGTWYVISKPQSILFERKTLKQIESKVTEHKKNEPTKNSTGLKDKSNINREDVR